MIAAASDPSQSFDFEMVGPKSNHTPAWFARTPHYACMRGGSPAYIVVRLTDVRLYDENSQPLDTSVTDGTISVTAPSSRDPKLWIVGGALQDDGTATVAVVLQGQGVTCGGNFDLCFDSSMKAAICR